MRSWIKCFALFLCVYKCILCSANIITPLEYYKANYSNLAYRELNNGSTLQSEFVIEKCFYVINDTYDIKGQIIKIPQGGVLFFNGDNAGFKSGIIELSDNCHLIGGRFSFTQNDMDYYIYPGAKMSSPVMVIDASNVIIENSTFNYLPVEEKISPAIIVYGKEKKIQNITIKNNTFKTSGVALFCDVTKSIICNNTFENSIKALRIETMYDHVPYRHPDSIIVRQNRIYGQDKSTTGPLAWISGISNVSFEENTIVSYSDAIVLYCGDGNIALDNITVRRNSFTLKKGSEQNKHKYCLLIRGKSYPFQRKGLTYGRDISISDNIFCSEENCNETQSTFLWAIAVNFVTDITISNNYSNGFSTFVSLTDDFSDLTERCSNVKIVGNHIYYTYENAIRLSTDINSCEISKNIIYNCNKKTNYHFDLLKLTNTNVNNNVIMVPEGYNRKTIIIQKGSGVINKNNTVIINEK